MPTQVSLLDGALASAGTLAIQTNGTTSAITISSAQVATFVNNPIMTGLTASRAVFTDGSKGLTSNAITGTGNVVMSASPTLTGTIDGAALTLSSSLTLSGGTANGVLYLNGSKVATSGSALTFDGAGVFSVVDSSSPRVSVNGSSTASGYLIFKNTTSNTNVAYVGYDFANSAMPFAVSGSEQMRLTSTGLGIGTSSPSQKLEVAGNILINTSGNPSMTVKTTGAGNNPWYRLQADTNYWDTIGVFSDANDTMQWQYNGSTKLTMTNDGNLGIGTSSPSYKLDVSAAKNTTNIKLTSTGLDSADDYTQLSFGDASNIYGAVRLGYNNPAVTSASYLAFYNNTGSSTTERMRLDSSGNLRLVNSNNIASITQTAITLTGAGGGGTGGQTVNVITANSTTRGILIVGSTQNCSAIFFINASNAVNLSSQTTNETRFSATSGAANTANVYVSGSNIVLQNNIQATRDFYVTFIGQV